MTCEDLKAYSPRYKGGKAQALSLSQQRQDKTLVK